MKGNFIKFSFEQKNEQKYSFISGLASKKGQIQIQGHFIPLIGGFYLDSLTLLFWFDLFLYARAEIQTYFHSFFGANKNLKYAFEIYWPL